MPGIRRESKYMSSDMSCCRLICMRGISLLQCDKENIEMSCSTEGAGEPVYNGASAYVRAETIGSMNKKHNSRMDMYSSRPVCCAEQACH
jgi:hypothetical protein